MAEPARPPQSPREMGYRMPAEWEPHRATVLAWPYDTVTFPSRVGAAEDVYVQILKAITPREGVELVVKDRAQNDAVTARLEQEGVRNVRLHTLGHVDVWARDWGPVFVTKHAGAGPGLGAVKWVFNAWGDKYEELKKDNAVAPRLLASMSMDGPVWEPGIVLEGGSIEVDGAGTLLTTEQCLLNKNRNPHVPRASLERYLMDHLGVRKVLWLGDGIEGDDTDGHVDDVARFVGPRTLLCAVEQDGSDPNHKVLEDARQRLSRMTDADGRPFEVVGLPMPGPVGDEEGRLPASYANFYIANGVVLAPVFGHANDAKAVAVLERVFPSRRVVPIRCEDLVYGMGTLHCVTQQVPATGAGPSSR